VRFSTVFRTFLSLFAANAAVCVPNRATADASQITLRWSAPESCPGEEAVRDRIVELTAPGVGIDASVVVTKTEGGFRAAVRVRLGPSVGEQVVDETSCARLAESAAVILAMCGTSPETPAPSPPSPQAFVLVSPAVPSSTLPPVVRIRAYASIDIGTLPTPTAGGAVAVAFTPGDHLAIGLAGAVWVNERGTSATLPGQGADFGLLTGDATGCYRLRVKAFELSPCAVVELAHIAATGFGTSHTLSPTATWLAVGVGASARWELTRHLAIAAELDGLVPTQGQSFVISRESGAASVHAIAAVAGRGYFGPEVRF
jgi:hypothetical protein